MLGISLDDTAEMLRDYAPKKEMNYPLLLMQDDFDEAYGPIFGVPITFFIGRDGTISRGTSDRCRRSRSIGRSRRSCSMITSGC